LIEKWQSRMGPDQIQVGNGRLPWVDPTVANLLAGIVYELYPNSPWGLTDREGLEMVLQHLEPGYLTPRRGRTWSLLCDTSGANADFSRISSALTGQAYVLYDPDGWVGHDVLDYTAENPRGDVKRKEDRYGVVTHSRAFETGTAIIETDPSGLPLRAEFVPK
jgi:hypothetical protein